MVFGDSLWAFLAEVAGFLLRFVVLGMSNSLRADGGHDVVTGPGSMLPRRCSGSG